MGKVIELKNTSQRALLRDAVEQQTLCRLWRGALEPGSFAGYVGGVGREFFLLWVIGDNLGFEGLYAMRHRDVSELEVPDKHHRFLERALQLKGLVPSWPPALPLDDVRALVPAAALQAPAIGIYVDSEDEPEVCYIGRLAAVEEDGFYLQEITPDAEWLTEPSFFAWDEVSTLSMHDGYATSLLAVAGAPPPVCADIGQRR